MSPANKFSEAKEEVEYHFSTEWRGTRLEDDGVGYYCRFNGYQEEGEEFFNDIIERVPDKAVSVEWEVYWEEVHRDVDKVLTGAYCYVRGIIYDTVYGRCSKGIRLELDGMEEDLNEARKACEKFFARACSCHFLGLFPHLRCSLLGVSCNSSRRTGERG